MMTALNEGVGLCQPTHQLSIRPVQAVLELGAVADVLHKALNAAHHSNRHGAPDNRIAIALPQLSIRRGLACPGHEVVLFGSATALESYVKLDGVQTLVRRSMIKELKIHAASFAGGELGTAYIRDRAAARRSPGAIRRAQERAARRGIAMPSKLAVRSPGPSILALHFGSAVVHIREVQAQIGANPLHVSTYGFSSAEAPAFLPIVPDRSSHRYDDAA